MAESTRHVHAQAKPPPISGYTKMSDGYRWCEQCGRGMRGPDACLGEIPGVSHACCGHGRPEGAYVVLGGAPNQSAQEFRNLTLRGGAAITFFDLIRLGVIEDPADGR